MQVYLQEAVCTLLNKSSRGSVGREPARCLGGHEFDSLRDSDFSMFHGRAMLNISSYSRALLFKF